MRDHLLLGHPERHPLEVGLVRLATAGGEVALHAGGVVLRTGVPRVVGDLVVVEDRDPRVPGVGGLQIGVSLVQGVPQPVSAQVGRLGGRHAIAHAGQAGRSVAVRAVAVLVDVVADVQDQVEVLASSDAAVGTEVATGVVAAGDQRQPQGMDDALLVRRGLGAAGGTELSERLEAVPVSGVGPEVVDVHLDGVVAPGIGPHAPASDDVPKARVRGDDPPHQQRPSQPAARRGHRLAPARWRGGPGPDDDSLASRVAAGNAVAEDAVMGGRRGHRLVEGACRADHRGRTDSGGSAQDSASGQGIRRRRHIIHLGPPPSDGTPNRG